MPPGPHRICSEPSLRLSWVGNGFRHPTMESPWVPFHREKFLLVEFGSCDYLSSGRFLPGKLFVSHPVRNLGLLLALLALCGCMSRRITVRTEPSGALVEMNGERLGVSPVSTNFTYYGTNEFKMSMPGYETQVVQQPTPPPWYQIPPLDFVTDNFLPFRVRDHREFNYVLAPRNPLQELDEQGLRSRGENFRSQSQSGSAGN